jgi:hypothetical protein
MSSFSRMISDDMNDALGIDPTAFDDAAMDLLFEDFPVLEDEAAFEDALLLEAGVYDQDPTGNALGNYA